MTKKAKKETKKTKQSTDGKSSNKPKATTLSKNSKSSAARGTGAKTTNATSGQHGDKSTSSKKAPTVVSHAAKPKQTKARDKSTEGAKPQPSNEEFEVTLTDSTYVGNNINSRGSYTGTESEPTSQLTKSTSIMYQNPIFYPDVGNLNASASELATPNTTTNAVWDKEDDATFLETMISLEKTSQTRPPAAPESQTLQVPSKATDTQSRSFANQLPSSPSSVSFIVTSLNNEPFVPGTMQNFDSETSIVTFDKAESHRTKQQQTMVKETKANTTRLAIPETISNTYVPTGATANYLRSLTSLQANKSGSRSSPQNTVKRHLISCRTTEGSSDPIGVLYGSIEGFIDCRNATHVLTSSGLLKEGDGNVSLDICQVDVMDGFKLAKISFLEAKVNLITIAPLVEGRVLLFDETSRGIELANTSHIKLDGDRVSLAIATFCPTPRFSLKNVGTLERNRFDQSKPHKVEVVSGSATLLLGNPVSGTNHSIATGTAPTRIDLVLVVQDTKEATIALDDSLFWDLRTHPFTLLTAGGSTSQRSESLIGKSRSGPMRISCGLQESDFVFTEVIEHSVEYLLLFGMLTDQGQRLAPLGIVTGQVDGFIHSPTVSLQGIANPSLMLNLVLVDSHNDGLMALRRRVLSAEHLVTVTVGGSATGNLCGDLGGGFLLAASTQLILACNRLLRLVNYQKNDRLGQIQLDKCQAQDVTAESKSRLAVYLGEITLLVTDGAKSLAYCTSN